MDCHGSKPIQKEERNGNLHQNQRSTTHPCGSESKLVAHGMEATPTPSGMSLEIDLAMTGSTAAGKSSGRMSSISARSTSLKNAASMKQKLKEILHATGVKSMPRT